MILLAALQGENNNRVRITTDQAQILGVPGLGFIPTNFEIGVDCNNVVHH